MKLTPIQTSFSAGEISPLMRQRSDTDGYREGVGEMTNMYPDSRGPSIARAGTRYLAEVPGNDARIMAIPVTPDFFYTAVFLDFVLNIFSLAGHNPSTAYGTNPSFGDGETGWTTDTDGNASSAVVFITNACELSVADKANRFAQIEQNVSGLTAASNYKLVYDMAGAIAPVTISVGTTQGGNDLVDESPIAPDGEVLFTTGGAQTDVWVRLRLASDNTNVLTTTALYLGVQDEIVSPVSFVTPYLETDLADLQGVVNPGGNAIYVLHEKYPPYKLVYDNINDAFSWDIVTFTAQPPEWLTGSYPSCGDFFEGRLWLGGTRNEPQTFWASKSGFPEDFTQGSLADDGLEFTMAKYGRIEWMVGFKNLVIGTINGEHIVTSTGGFIKPDDILVEQQSSYGSAGVQPVQVGDQIFYVSADRTKLRAIQYEWQKDNWLSRDLTFNSQHITKPGIRHIVWQQNPGNFFHCMLNDGTIAAMVYERGNNVYGWFHVHWAGITDKGLILDAAVGPLDGVDFLTIVAKTRQGIVNLESQTPTDHKHYMDSWVDRVPEEDGVTITGLDHLEGMTVQVLTDNASHPDRVVSGGQITLQPHVQDYSKVTVGRGYEKKVVTLPFDQGAPAGSGAPWMKRWNKIYVRVLQSSHPLINGSRAPSRHAATLMDEVEPVTDEDVLVINLGFDKSAIVTIEQDLPRELVVLGVFGELGQSVT